MLKRMVSWSLCLAMLMSIMLAPGAFALNYSGSQQNEATFETLEETRVSGPVGVQNLEQNTTKKFISHPVLNGYPEGTTFIYRSANLFGGRAAARLNTNILVFAEQHFDEKAAALDYLKGLGLIDIIDEAIGSVILVTPADGIAFGDADQKNYYALQTAICAQKAGGVDAEGNRIYYSDAEYSGGYGNIYAVGIEGGATFLNNYVAGVFDYVTRLAGMLLVGGSLHNLRDVCAMVPVYLVNPTEKVLTQYKRANEVDASEVTDETTTYFNQARPLQKVILAKTEKDLPSYIKAAYYDMFIKAMRVPVIKQGLYSASSPYQGYNFDQAPYSLCARSVAVNGVTADGIHVIRHDEDRFSDLQAEKGEYLQTWFEYLPEEVVNGTAPAGSVPLLLANHGGSDDPRVFVEEFGLLALAGKERFAMVAPEHQYISGETREIEMQALPAIVRYMLETYPALDASRVYVTGYSMGAGATLKSIYGDPGLFAAAVPMSPIPGIGTPYVPSEEVMTNFDGVKIPVMFSTSGSDIALTFIQSDQGISEVFQVIVDRFIGVNGTTKVDAYDFVKYPYSGFKGDKVVTTMLNNEYENIRWYLNDENGVPMVALSFTEKLVHALYPEYGYMAWDFMKHYSRDLTTGEIIYNPYVD